MYLFLSLKVVLICTNSADPGEMQHYVQHNQAFSKVCVPKIYFSYFSTKTYVVGTQKNRLNETILLSTQNIC